MKDKKKEGTGRDYFKEITGQTKKEFLARPSWQNIADSIFKQTNSDYPLRLLGTADGVDIEISEEERHVNFHILGAPGEGKSKFLEYHIRKDIDAGLGLCLIDPSEKGDTAQNVLNYCAKIGYEKVILIDPTLISDYKKIPCLAPLNRKSVKRSAEGVMEALNILFDSKSTSTPRIKRYLTALLRILAQRGMTLKDAGYFTDYYSGKGVRDKILGFDRDSQTIKSVFKTPFNFETYFSSSINRLDALWQEPLASILSNTEGINFKRAVGDGWVILVNLSPYQLTEDEAQLLGILVISQIVQAVDTLVNSDWKGVFYLYLDEVGRFATPQIETLLSYKRKSGIRLYLAHHHFAQFEDRRKVLSAIENNTRMKLMFNTPNYDDRMRMIKSLGYGGDIPPVVAAYANQDLPQQHAVFKKKGVNAVRIKIPDVPDVSKAPREYVEKLLNQPWYKDVRTIREDIKSPEFREVDVNPAVSKTAVQRSVKKDIRQDKQTPPPPPDRKPIKI